MMMTGQDEIALPAHKKELRIYIGGMDPLRGLTSQDVLHRLETRLKERPEGSNLLQMNDLHVGDCYFQFTICTTKGDDDDHEDPLAVIKSWFHNVTWKGCKLRVDEARPHFLQRLQDEIQLRNQSRHQPAESVGEEKAQTTTLLDDQNGNNNNNETVISSTSGDADAAASSVLPRHWRIRRGFGETAHHVDTQPCRVTDWAMFSRTRERCRVQQKKMTQSLETDPKKLSYYNRSIHFIFPDSDNGDGVVGRQLNREASGASSDHDSSDQNSSATEENGKLKNGSKYIWSDDDDGDSSDSSSADDSSHADTAAQQIPLTMVLDAAESLSEESDTDEGLQNDSPHVPDRSFEETLEEPSCDLHEKSELLETNAGREYVWSDGDESFSEENAGSSERRKIATLRELKPTDDGLNEFAPGVVDFDDASLNERARSADEPTTCSSDDVDLQQDVEKNLRVLSRLFPELSKEVPIQIKSNDAEKSEKDVNNPRLLSGWGAMGQMLRFDPTNPQSANLLMLDADSKDASAKSENQTSESDSSSTGVEGAEETKLMKDSTQDNNSDHAKKLNIYEQTKLEQVFKEVRESTIPVTQSGSDAVASGFSFGFDLGDAKPIETTKAPEPFSFSFPHAEINASTTNDEKYQQDNISDDAQEWDPVVAHLKPQRRQPRAFEFPSEEELDERVRHFYCDFNEGARMMNDLEGWRNDPSVKERWMKERFALTQDWKRKRKYAMSKKQKRFK